MDDIIATLQSLLRDNFHVTANDTARHDQWFKRVYQSWAEKDKELLLLTPRVSRDEWAPKLLQFSAQLALHIRNLAAAERQRLDASFPPRDDKLFPDSVLDEPPLMSPLNTGREQTPAPSPRVQRGDWWPGKDLVDLAHVGTALLEHEQTAALVRVAQMRGVGMGDAADIGKHKRGAWRWLTEPGTGWGTLPDEALLIFFFAAIVGTFPDQLLTDKAMYTNWLPYGELLSGLQPPERFVEALKKRPGGRGGGLRSPADVQPHVKRCVRILAAADVLYEACRLPAVDWASRISSAMLHFVGFEAWNRAREGDTYLRCDFNRTKDEQWLAQGLEGDWQEEGEAGDGGEEEDKANRVVGARLVRPRDSLRLREPRGDAVGSDEEDGEGEENSKLGELEQAEAVYGVRRSTKYQRRRVDA